VKSTHKRKNKEHRLFGGWWKLRIVRQRPDHCSGGSKIGGPCKQLALRVSEFMSQSLFSFRAQARHP
jgi:hypothetical protein